MTTTTRNAARGTQQRLELGSYVRDDTRHVLVATRDPDGRWQLLDTAADATSVIETFYPDEPFEAVRAVAELYVNDMTAPAEHDTIA